MTAFISRSSCRDILARRLSSSRSSTMYGGNFARSGLPVVAGGERARIAVLHVARRRIEHLRQLVDRVDAVPLGARIGAVDRLAPVELRIAARDEAVVEIKDVAGLVGVDHVHDRKLLHVPARCLNSVEVLGFDQFESAAAASARCRARRCARPESAASSSLADDRARGASCGT